jgi:hypothetical protein
MKWEQDLAYDIRVNDQHDTIDHWAETYPSHPNYPCDWIEMSENNRREIKEKFLRVRDHAKCILEIGVVQHQVENSSYIVFKENKKLETVYVGLDVRNKAHLQDKDNNMYLFQGNSSDLEQNMEKIRALGVEEFDFIFIDGDHSVGQILRDWEYTKFLAPQGIVGFHDTSIHPGPVKFVAALNRDIWHVEENLCPSDWGVGFCWKK